MIGLDNTPIEWAEAARGRVLEVGLGKGVLASLVDKSMKVKEHIVVEEIPFIANTRPGTILGTFPNVPLKGRFDTILLDIPNALSYLEAASKLLNDGGILCVRTK